MNTDSQATLYFTQGSCSVASLAALEEVGIPFNARRLEMGLDGAGDEEFARLSPLRQVPLLRNADGRVVRETGAILTLLADEHPAANLLPADKDARISAMQWFGFLGGTVHPVFRTLWRPSRWVGEDPAAQSQLMKATPRYLMRVLAVTASQLRPREWVLGTRSAVDFYLHVFTRWSLGSKVPLPAELMDHHARVAALPAMIRAVERERNEPLATAS